jgi:tetratricopeptide (TPR) repeat protein
VWLTALAVWLPSARLDAQERRARIDVEHYRIEAEVNPKTQSVNAVVSVRFIPIDDTLYSTAFELNNALQVSQVVDGMGRQISASRSHQDFSVRVNFPEPLPKGKPSTLVFTYQGTLTGKEESPVWGIKFASIQEDYAFLMYPARWFPINEYTTDRYTAEMKISVPDGFKVVASGLESRGAASLEKTVYEYNFSRSSFPGSIAVVRSEPVPVRSGGVTSLIYFRGENQQMAGAYGEELAKVMAFLTGLFGQPFQAGLAVVETEDGAPNGYSAPGILFLNSRSIGKTVNARLLANQAARQWWFVQISPATRNHMWITNGAARLAELLWIENTAGPAALEAELRDTYVEALTVEDPPVIQSARLEDYSPEYWAVTAAKGAAVLSMLRYVTGEQAFSTMLKQVPETYAWKSVTTDDFRKVVETIAQRDMRGFFIQWIESKGAPEFKLEYTVFRTTNGFRVMGKISQDLDTFRMPVDLEIETEGNPEYKTVEVVGTSSEFIVDTFGRPKKVNIDTKMKVLRFSDRMRVAVAIRRGEMFAEISEFSEAHKEYQKALDVNRNSSLAYYRVGELFFLQRTYQSAVNMFREALSGDLEPKWIEVWAHINMGKIFDLTGQRERAVNEYNLAIRTKDNTQGAQEEAAKYLKTPYERPPLDQ